MTTYYCMDFETTVPDEDDESIETLETRVWSWGICELYNPDNTFMYGTKISSFIEWCSKNKKIVYVHNLKFDGKFLIDYLIRSGFVYDEDRKTNNSFTTLISDYGQFYSIEITFKAYKKDRLSTIFYDSSKKVPLSIAQISESFNLPMKKGSIDYKKERPEGYEPDQEELAYLKDDVMIMAYALKMQHDQNLKRMTIGGDALNDYKKRVGKNFKQWFPDILDDKGIMFDELKRFYRGGFTYVNPTYKGLDVGEGCSYDVTSLYPSVMKNELLPVGQPIKFVDQYDEKWKDIFPLYCQYVHVEFKLKKGHIPCVVDRSGYTRDTSEYLIETEEFQGITLYLTNIELQLLFDHYDIIDIQYQGGFMFEGKTGLFDDYIDHWISVKEQATKDGNMGLRQISKLMLNSLYGKFGKNIYVGNKMPVYHKEWDRIVYPTKPVKKDEDGNRIPEKGVYIPIAIFVTSYARDKMIRSAQTCYDRFLYCDTDSLHILGLEDPKGIELDNYKLGAWKYEGAFKRARFLRAKAYVHEYAKKKIRKKTWLMRSTLDVKCAGMTDHIKNHVTFDNFQFGFTCDGKKTPKGIRGGVMLVDTTYTLVQ